MRKSFLSAVMAATVSAVALTPVVTGGVMLTADAAYAKQGKSRGDERSGGRRQGRGGSESSVSTASATGNGQSWKTRIEGGVLSLHPSEYGAWNSARRNPKAIEQMVRKYEETGSTNGAAGMIGMFVSAYNDYNEAQAEVYAAAQTLVDAGLVDVANAQAYLDGDLTEESILAAIAALDDGDAAIELEVIDGEISCADDGVSGACGATDYSDLQAQLDDYEALEGDGALQAALDDLDTASEDLETAQSGVQPRTSTSEDDAGIMLGDVEQLLGVEIEEQELTDPPA